MAPSFGAVCRRGDLGRGASRAMTDWSVEDWSRERPRQSWDPGCRLLRSIRRYQRWRSRGWFGRLLSRWFVLEHRFWSGVAGADIPLNSRIGGGLLLPHPVGIVIHPWATIGPNCLISTPRGLPGIAASPL